VTGRVGEHPPAARLAPQQDGAQREDLLLCRIEVRDVQVEVELLRVRGVRPAWRPVLVRPLERQDEPGVRVQRREGVIDRPARVGPSISPPSSAA
jgi:hypothetical protein